MTDPRSSVEKAASLLVALESHTAPMATLTQLSRSAGLAKSTTHRLLSLLESAGLVRRSSRFWYGSRVGEDDRIRSRSIAGVREAAMPVMTDLHLQTGESVLLGVRDAADVLVVEKVFGLHSTGGSSEVGSRRPLLMTALGVAILAEAPRSILEADVGPLSEEVGAPRRAVLHQIHAARRAGVTIRVGRGRDAATCIAAPVRSVFGLDVGLALSGNLAVVTTPASQLALRSAVEHVWRRCGEVTHARRLQTQDLASSWSGAS